MNPYALIGHQALNLARLPNSATPTRLPDTNRAPRGLHSPALGPISVVIATAIGPNPAPSRQEQARDQRLTETVRASKVPVGPTASPSTPRPRAQYVWSDAMGTTGASASSRCSAVR